MSGEGASLNNSVFLVLLKKEAELKKSGGK